MAMWEEKNSARARFQEQIPCKLQDIIENALQIPGEIKAYCVKWVNSFAMAKTTFFSNRSQLLTAGAFFFDG